jgi:hypothetical protein
MLNKISAALIAVSMLAAPAMAAGTKTETAPITKSVTPAAKLQVKPGVRNANAAMTHHHYRLHRHHRSHLSAYKANKISAHKTGKLSAYKTGKVSKVTIKQPGSATKRG